MERPEEHFKPGDTHQMKIIKVNEGEKKVGLSIRAVKSDEYTRDYQTYKESSGSTERSTLAEAFRVARERQAAEQDEE